MTNASQNIELRARTTRFLEASYTVSNPTQYMMLGDALEFNYAPVVPSVFRVDYYSEPEMLIDAAQEPAVLACVA